MDAPILRDLHGADNSSSACPTKAPAQPAAQLAQPGRKACWACVFGVAVLAVGDRADADQERVESLRARLHPTVAAALRFAAPPLCFGSSRQCIELDPQHALRAPCCTWPRAADATSCNTPLLRGFGSRRLVLNCFLATRCPQRRAWASRCGCSADAGDPRPRFEDQQLSPSFGRLDLTTVIPVEERAENTGGVFGVHARPRWRRQNARCSSAPSFQTLF